jgi:hypothetical protein
VVCHATAGQLSCGAPGCLGTAFARGALPQPGGTPTTTTTTPRGNGGNAVDAAASAEAAAEQLAVELMSHGFEAFFETYLSKTPRSRASGADAGAHARLVLTADLDRNDLTNLLLYSEVARDKATAALEHYKTHVLGAETLTAEVVALERKLKEKQKALAALAAQEKQHKSAKRPRAEEGEEEEEDEEQQAKPE